MGRRNWGNGKPQRTKLVSNREERTSLEKHAFALYRPVDERSADSVFAVLKDLQREEDIPGDVHLYSEGHHASLIQERRMRKSLARGLAVGFVASRALLRAEAAPGLQAADSVRFRFTGAAVIGRNRNIIIGRIADDEGVLSGQRAGLKEVFDAMGVHVDFDKHDHVTLGESPKGMTATESRHVEHVVAETLDGLEGTLQPLWVEQGGRHFPLAGPNQVPRH